MTALPPEPAMESATAAFVEATSPRAGAHARAFFPGSTFNPPRDKLNLPADKSNLRAGKLNVHAGKLDLPGGRWSLPEVRARKRGPPFSMAVVRRHFAGAPGGARYVSPGGPRPAAGFRWVP